MALSNAVSDRGRAFHLVEAAWGLRPMGKLLISAGGMPGDFSVLCGEASCVRRPRFFPSARPSDRRASQSLIMKTWSKGVSIPPAWAGQPKRRMGQKETAMLERHGCRRGLIKGAGCFIYVFIYFHSHFTWCIDMEFHTWKCCINKTDTNFQIKN